jgi:hypothetical protein
MEAGEHGMQRMAAAEFGISIFAIVLAMVGLGCSLAGLCHLCIRSSRASGLRLSDTLFCQPIIDAFRVGLQTAFGVVSFVFSLN